MVAEPPMQTILPSNRQEHKENNDELVKLRARHSSQKKRETIVGVFSPGQLFLEPLIWLELAESRRPELSDLRLARPIVIGRRYQGQRPAYRNHHDCAHALRERTSEMSEQRFE